MEKLGENKSSEKLLQIFENAAVVLILVDIDGRVVHINKAGVNMTGNNKDNVLGRLAGEAFNCINAFNNGYVECGKGEKCFSCPIRNSFSDTFRSGKEIYQKQGDFDVNIKGKVVRLNLLVSTSIITLNNEQYVLITIDDISKEKQFQKELKDTLNKYKEQSKKLRQTLNDLNILNSKLIESEEYIRTILETEPECVKIIDLNEKLAYMNPAGLSMIDADNLEQIKGRSIYNLATNKYRKSLEDLIRKTLNGGKGKLEFEIVGLKGRNIWLETNSVPLYHQGNKIAGALGITRDITERKKIEKTLKDRETQLKELNATKDIFFSIIAHDLRNPFNTIEGFTELLLENNKCYSNEDKEQFIRIIAESSQNAQKLLENLLEWSKIQTGKIKFIPKKVYIESIINTAINQTKSSANKKNIQISYSEKDNKIVCVDKLMMNTILRNLLTNAIKFTPKFGNISINTVEKENELIISVIDTGIGISQKNIKKLFKISEKFSSLGTEQEHGSGLGLLLCKEFVEMHGGKIWVKSEEGKGSCFSLSIPSDIQPYC